MSAPRTVTQQQLGDDPYIVWNQFVDMLAMSDYNDLTETQRAAHLVFWYESEVQNGGHLQYFENQGIERIEEVIASLRRLGADKYAEILREAAAQLTANPCTRIESAQQYVERALQGEFDSLDRSFGACSPSLIQFLEALLQKHQPEFVEVVD